MDRNKDPFAHLRPRQYTADNSITNADSFMLRASGAQYPNHVPGPAGANHGVALPTRIPMYHTYHGFVGTGQHVTPLPGNGYYQNYFHHQGLMYPILWPHGTGRPHDMEGRQCLTYPGRPFTELANDKVSNPTEVISSEPGNSRQNGICGLLDTAAKTCVDRSPSRAETLTTSVIHKGNIGENDPLQQLSSGQSKPIHPMPSSEADQQKDVKAGNNIQEGQDTEVRHSSSKNNGTAKEEIVVDQRKFHNVEAVCSSGSLKRKERATPQVESESSHWRKVASSGSLVLTSKGVTEADPSPSTSYPWLAPKNKDQQRHSSIGSAFNQAFLVQHPNPAVNETQAPEGRKKASLQEVVDSIKGPIGTADEERFKALEKIWALQEVYRAKINVEQQHKWYYKKRLTKSIGDLKMLRDRQDQQEITIAKKIGEVQALLAREDEYKLADSEKDKAIYALKHQEEKYITAILERDGVIQSLKALGCDQKTEKRTQRLNYSDKQSQTVDDNELKEVIKNLDAVQEEAAYLRKELEAFQEDKKATLASHDLKYLELQQKHDILVEDCQKAEAKAIEDHETAQHTIASLREELISITEESNRGQAEQERTLTFYRSELDKKYQRQKKEHLSHEKTISTLTQELKTTRKDAEVLQGKVNASKEESEAKKEEQEQAVKSLRAELLGSRQDLKNQKVDHERALAACNNILETRNAAIQEVRRRLEVVVRDVEKIAGESERKLQVTQDQLKEAHEELASARHESKAKNTALQLLKAESMTKEADHKKVLDAAKKNLESTQKQNKDLSESLERQTTQVTALQVCHANLEADHENALEAVKKDLESIQEQNRELNEKLDRQTTQVTALKIYRRNLEAKERESQRSLKEAEARCVNQRLLCKAEMQEQIAIHESQVGDLQQRYVGLHGVVIELENELSICKARIGTEDGRKHDQKIVCTSEQSERLGHQIQHLDIEAAKQSGRADNPAAMSTNEQGELPGPQTEHADIEAPIHQSDNAQELDSSEIKSELEKAEALYKEACAHSTAAQHQSKTLGELIDYYRQRPNCMVRRVGNELHEAQKEASELRSRADSAITEFCKHLSGKDLQLDAPQPAGEDPPFAETYIQKALTRVESKLGLSIKEVFTPWEGEDQELAPSTLTFIEGVLRRMEGFTVEEKRAMLDEAVNGKDGKGKGCKPRAEDFKVLNRELMDRGAKRRKEKKDDDWDVESGL